MEGITIQLLMLQVVTGIALGSIYALLAIGLSLIFGMLTIVNFAHGAFFMVGAFLGVYFLGPAGSGSAWGWCRWWWEGSGSHPCGCWGARSTAAG